PEFYFHAGILHSIDPARIVLIRGSWVLTQNLKQGLPFFFRYFLPPVFRTLHLERIVLYPVCKTAPGAWYAVYISQIRLDVIDRSPFHHVSSPYMKNRAFLSIQVHTCQLHTGKTNGIWPERGTGGKHADSL